MPWHDASLTLLDDLVLPSDNSLIDCFEDRLDCLGLSDFSLVGELDAAPSDTVRCLVDLGNAGKSRPGEYCKVVFFRLESTPNISKQSM